MSGRQTPIIPVQEAGDLSTGGSAILLGDVEELLDRLPNEPLFDLIVTSPPYNMGKAYDRKMTLEQYFAWQKGIIEKLVPRLKDTGSICWQVGNYVDNGCIYPLDIGFAPIFSGLSLRLKNRIVWHYGHGLHCKRRFSGRYEVILWYTKSERYPFNLDAVRVPSKYPGKRHFKGEKKGQLSGNPLGKNPEDVWDIPNVKANHIEKTAHPCQFPVSLAERLILALTDKGQLVFDPFCGVASSGVAALLHRRAYWGCELLPEYAEIGRDRLEKALSGTIRYRPLDRPIYSPRNSKLSSVPQEWDHTQTFGGAAGATLRNGAADALTAPLTAEK